MPDASWLMAELAGYIPACMLGSVPAAAEVMTVLHLDDCLGKRSVL